MKKFNILFILFFLSIQLWSQLAPTKYFIGFTDKQGTIYSLSNPISFLSQRAIDRRINQSLQLDSSDLPVNTVYIDSILNLGNINLLNVSRWLNGIIVQTTDTLVFDIINNFGFVQQVRPLARISYTGNSVSKLDQPIVIETKSTPIGQISTQAQSINSFNYGLSLNQIEMIGVDFMHNQGFTGSGMIIAVLDAGFYRVDSLDVFDSIRDNGQILGTRDFVEPGQNVYDSHTHGMMVLSLMGGNMPGQLIGTAPHASYWLLRSENAPTEYVIEEYNWVCAAEYADSLGADIINSSLGYYEFDDTLQNYSYSDLNGQTAIVSRGANFAASKGILVVNSAGNAGQTSWQRIIAPADAPGALTAGSVDFDQNYSSFSSVGPSSDGRGKPDVASQGEGTLVADTQNGIMSGNVTSFSAPLITGAVACLWGANPLATNWQVMQAIRQSAHQYNNPDSLLGYGIPNFAVAHMLLSGVKIDTEHTSHSLHTFPNPFDDFINLIYYAVDTHTINIELFDFSGKRVYVMENFKCYLGYNSLLISELDNLSQGIYFLKVSSLKMSETRKLVKTY
ncbi:MAG: S8 family serine peptidase [Bacteroidales bacterium]|nr:S8 family serine peptidase [Bacteroidales bacterium]